MPTSTVWVINRSAHDYTPALTFGNIEFLSEGPLDKLSVVDMDRQFRDKLAESKPTDYILLTSLNVMSAIACVCFALQHRRLNLLIYKDKGYIERTLIYDYVCKEDK